MASKLRKRELFDEKRKKENMEPVPSRPSFVMGDKGIGQVRRVYNQTGGWISAEVPRPPGYQLAKYIKRQPRKKK